MSNSTGAAVRETSPFGETIHVFGDLDEHSAGAFEDVLESALRFGRPITVDLTRCRYIGSVGLRALLRAQRQAVEFTTIVDERGVAARVLDIAKLEKHLGVRRVAHAHTGSIRAFDTRDYVRIITLDGEWDLSRGNELRRRLERAISHPRIVLDLSNVTYIDSNCVGMLVRMRTQRVVKGYDAGRLVLPDGNVRRVLGIVGAHALWSIHDSLEDALEGWK